MKKLGLGTVQFGQAYGVSNTRGQVDPDVAGAILMRAAQAGVSWLDTAANYGEAETVLSVLDTKPFHIVTKTISVAQGVDAVIARVRRSAALLGRVDRVLVHSAADLTGPDGDTLWTALRRLKDEGVVGGIGVSVYVADDPAALAACFRPDAIQLPFSLLDQRLLRDGTLAQLKDLGVEIHARSLFLQGLLFLDELPAKLRSAAPALAAIKARIREGDTTPLAAALGFVLARPEIDAAIVGVTTLNELDEILSAAASPLPALDWENLALADETVLTPSLW
jgi:aryl-alcohol dehydrogenase-like predicted oxidoreductase